MRCPKLLKYKSCFVVLPTLALPPWPSKLGSGCCFPISGCVSATAAIFSVWIAVATVVVVGLIPPSSLGPTPAGGEGLSNLHVKLPLPTTTTLAGSGGHRKVSRLSWVGCVAHVRRELATRVVNFVRPKKRRSLSRNAIH